MPHCCEDKVGELEVLRGRQSSVLKIVLVINAVMFFIEAGAGLFARSTALLADSLDMLGDALVYAFSLAVVDLGIRWRAAVSLLKGLIMGAFGAVVLIEAAYKVLNPAVPVVETMGIVGLLALSANTVCLYLLWRHREDDLNMRSTWLCSRNDVVANLAVLVAAAGVWSMKSMWPDIVIGLSIAALFLRSAVYVITESVKA